MIEKCFRCKKKIKKGCVIEVIELPKKDNHDSFSFSLCQNCRIIVGSIMNIAFDKASGARL